MLHDYEESPSRKRNKFAGFAAWGWQARRRIQPESNTMYKVRGTDGKEYGPVPSATLRQWIKEGRANLQTLVQAEGTDAWQPVSILPEFSDLLVVAAPPGLTAASAPAKTSGLAIASLVLGLLGLCSAGITALIGLILGIVALVKIPKEQRPIGRSGPGYCGLVRLRCVSPHPAHSTRGLPARLSKGLSHRPEPSANHPMHQQP